MGEGSIEQNPFAPPSAEADVHGFDEEQESYRLATLSQRWVGSALDGVLYVCAFVPGVVIGSMYDKFDELAVILGGLGWLGLAIYQWYLVSTTGQSLAKRWIRTRIIRESGELPGFLYGVVLRSWVIMLAGVIPFLGSFVGIADCVSIFMGTRRQTLHDRIARTLVVQV